MHAEKMCWRKIKGSSDAAAVLPDSVSIVL